MASNLNYIAARLDLAVVRNGGVPIPEVGIGSAYDSVIVQQLPLGALIEMAWGETGEPKFFPLLMQGQSFVFKDNKDCPLFVTEGLFIRNPAGVGTVILIVNFRSSD